MCVFGRLSIDNKIQGVLRNILPAHCLMSNKQALTKVRNFAWNITCTCSCNNQNTKSRITTSEALNSIHKIDNQREDYFKDFRSLWMIWGEQEWRYETAEEMSSIMWVRSITARSGFATNHRYVKLETACHCTVPAMTISPEYIHLYTQG